MHSNAHLDRPACGRPRVTLAHALLDTDGSPQRLDRARELGQRNRPLWAAGLAVAALIKAPEAVSFPGGF